MNLDQIIFIIAGVFTIVIGMSGFGINSRKAQRLVRLIGETPTRLLYLVIGAALIVMAFAILK